MDRRALIVASAVVVLIAAIYLSSMEWGGHDRTLSAVVQKYAFIMIVPPSTLVPPGTIVTIVKDDPLVVGIICPARDALGAELQAKLQVSASASSKEAEELTGKFKLDAEVKSEYLPTWIPSS
jgi:hypothetical protein